MNEMNEIIKESLENADVTLDDLREDLQKQIMEIQAELDALYQGYLDGDVSAATYDDSLETKANYLAELLS